ncbi:MAG TPA: hypothetical protein EYG97_01935 [Arcobacter sp.]|nr:hypothetical protein [Arcobacter sp.]HIP55762.1 hypothetical protein [Arcobacter sp.]
MSKKGFGLISVLILLVVFSFLSVNIVQSQAYSSKIDTLKYLSLQANIHMYTVKQFIIENDDVGIDNFKLDDERFSLDIKKEDLTDTSKYHIYIKTVDDTKVSNYDSVVK